MNRSGSRIIFSLILIGSVLISYVDADEVVLTSGERFSSPKVWEEKDKIRFNMHGLVVSVNKSDVAAVIRTNGTVKSGFQPTQRNPIQPPSTGAPSVKTPSPHKVSGPAKQPPPPSQAAANPVQKRAASKRIVQGIGFNGISWHMRPDDLPGLAKIKTEPVYGGIDQYWRPDGSMTLGNVLLDGLVFGFWQDRLYSIMIWVEGEPAYRRLQKVVFDRYGEGQKSKNSQDQYVWVKDKTTDRLLEFDKKRNIGIFWMRSRELDAHIKQIYHET
jgi:hypothetical protein